MHSISRLLPRAIDAMHIRPQVEATLIVEAANAWLDQTIPADLRNLTQAVKYQEKRVHVVCVMGAVGAFVAEREQELIGAVLSRVPQAAVCGVVIKTASLPTT